MILLPITIERRNYACIQKLASHSTTFWQFQFWGCILIVPNDMTTTLPPFTWNFHKKISFLSFSLIFWSFFPLFSVVSFFCLLFDWLIQNELIFWKFVDKITNFQKKCNWQQWFWVNIWCFYNVRKMSVSEYLQEIWGFLQNPLSLARRRQKFWTKSAEND